MGCVYLLTFPNGKQYVGMTTKSVEQRMCEHVSNAQHGDSEILYSAIRKHGTPDVEVLEVAEDQYLLQLLEIDYIAGLNTKIAGYNLTDGGECLAGYKHTDAQRAANRERALKQFADPMVKAEHWKKIRRGVTAESRARSGSATRERWQDPEFRSKTLALLVEARRTSEFRKAAGERSRQRWADPEYRAKHLLTVKRNLQLAKESR